MNTPATRAERGRTARNRVPRSSHAVWIPSVDRPDPVAVLERQGRDLLPELLPIRYGRMSASPFAFLRGAAAVMAADLAAQPHTGLTVQLCGDAHLLNFGLYASPERSLLFDINDFDETFPGPFEWDVKRLAASVAVAARENGHDEAKAHRAAGRPSPRTARACAGWPAWASWRSGTRAPTPTACCPWCVPAVAAGTWTTASPGPAAAPASRPSANSRRSSTAAAASSTTRHSSNRPARPTWPACARSSATTAPRSPRNDGCSWTATASSTRPARSSVSGASACAASSCCWRGGMSTTRCSCRSRRRGRPYWRSICRSVRTIIPAAAWSWASGCSRRRATSSWAG